MNDRPVSLSLSFSSFLFKEQVSALFLPITIILNIESCLDLVEFLYGQAAAAVVVCVTKSSTFCHQSL